MRTLALTDTFMPTKPVTPDSSAPIRKPIADTGPRKIKHQGDNDHADDGDGAVLASEIGLRAFLNGGGDVAHPLVTGGRLEHLHGGDDSVEHGEQAAAEGDIKQVHGFSFPVLEAGGCGRRVGAALEKSAKL